MAPVEEAAERGEFLSEKEIASIYSGDKLERPDLLRRKEAKKELEEAQTEYAEVNRQVDELEKKLDGAGERLEQIPKEIAEAIPPFKDVIKSAQALGEALAVDSRTDFSYLTN